MEPKEAIAKIAAILDHTGMKPGDIFTHVDLTRSGLLTRTKFDQAIASIPMTPKMSRHEVKELFKFMDKKNDGAVNRKEFCNSLMQVMSEHSEARVAEAGALPADPDDDTAPPRAAAAAAAAAVRRAGVRRRPTAGTSSGSSSSLGAAGRGSSGLGGSARAGHARTPAAGAGAAASHASVGGRSSPSHAGVGGHSAASHAGVGGHSAASPAGVGGHAAASRAGVGHSSPSHAGVGGHSAASHAGAGGHSAASHAGVGGHSAASHAGVGGHSAASHAGVGGHSLPSHAGVGGHSAASHAGVGGHSAASHARVGGYSAGSPTGAVASHRAGTGGFGARAAHPSLHHAGSPYRSAHYGTARADTAPMLAAPLKSELVLTSGGIYKGSGRLPLVLGSYDWIRKANGPRDRQLRAESASQTLTACERGGYTLDGKRAPIEHIKEMVERTCLFRARNAVLPETGRFDTKWFCWPRGLALQLAIEGAQEGNQMATVNAASAYSMGGGFWRGGRHALEESMCMQSTLAQSLKVASEIAKTQHVHAPSYARPARNAYGRPWECHIPEDGAILSPHVEVFRGSTFDGYPFFTAPLRLAAIISIAMPNANEKVSDAPCDVPPMHVDYLKLLIEKFKALLGAALEAEATHLVMPDVGCGVYGNDPRDVGRAFGMVVKEHFPGAFAEIALTGSKTFADSVLAGAGACASKEDIDGDEVKDVAGDTLDEGEETDEEVSRRLLRIFQRFDLDGDEAISREELAYVLQILDEDFWTDEKVEDLMDHFDVNGDGYFRYEEFSRWVVKRDHAEDEVSQAFRDDVGLNSPAGKIVVDGIAVTSH